jgi:OmpA-OmpF porin, OOP family
MKKNPLRTGAITVMLAFAFAGCSTISKNDPPPPVQPIAEAPAPAPIAPPEKAPEPQKFGKIIISGVNFDFDKSTLKPHAKEILDHAVSQIQAHPDLRFQLTGHTDSVGSDAYNQNLSERRVNAVLDYLVQHGVSGHRLDAIGYGESQPVATNETAEGRAQNRRVEIEPSN